jgi:hypothetical protein
LENFEAWDGIGRPRETRFRPRTPLSARKDRLVSDEESGGMPVVIIEIPQFIGKES